MRSSRWRRLEAAARGAHPEERAHVEIEYRELSFGEDMRDVAVSFEKIGRVLGFRARRGVEGGIVEIRDAIETGLIKDPSSAKYRNNQFIVN